MDRKVLSEQIVNHVEARAAVTSRQLLAMFGRYVDATTAVRKDDDMVRAERKRRSPYAGPRSLAERVRSGRRIFLNQLTKHLVRVGKIVRVSKGVYGPARPRIYRPKTG